ncbi:MAG: right-handed parallel beta-helix repeat-containing protein, partial [Clostridia bacterium]|nr:right-handed parallel beta-helix repeat-containing protein [Clostridia bacterium]
MKNSFKRIIPLFLVLTMVITTLAAVTVSADAPDLTQDFVKTFKESDSTAQAEDSLIRVKDGEAQAYMLRGGNDIQGRNSGDIESDTDYGIALPDGSNGSAVSVIPGTTAMSGASNTIYGIEIAGEESSNATPRAWFDKSTLKDNDKIVVSVYVKASNADEKTKFNLGIVNNASPEYGYNVFTDTYGKEGMDVTDTWKKFSGVITIPGGFEKDSMATRNWYTIQMGYPQNTAEAKINVSCIYAAKAKAVDIETNLDKSAAEPGSTLRASAKILNQVGTTGGVSQDVTWYITDETRTQIITDGITVSADGEITISDTAESGTYYAVAVANADETMVSGKSFKIEAGAIDLTKDFSSNIVLQTATQRGSDNLVMVKSDQAGAYMLRNSNDFNGRNSAFVNPDATEIITYYDGVTNGSSTILQKHTNASSDTTDESAAVHGTSLTTEESSGALPRTWFDKSGLKPGDKLLVSIYAKTVEEGKITKFNLGLSKYNSPSATAFTDKYGKEGMEVTNEWKQFVGIITVPSDFTAADAYTLHFGFAQNTKMEKMNVSCIYAAKLKTARFDLTLGETSLENGKSTTAKASLTNQAGTADGLSSDFKWYVTNEDRTEIITDSGITVTPGANSGEATISVTDTAKRGNYFIVAAAKSGEIKGQMIEVGGIDPNMKELELYVAPNGNDSNTGTIDKPFKTLEKARDYIRNFKKRDIPITVYLRGGEYLLSTTLSLGASDGGTAASAPVTYKAYSGEDVVITGSKTYDISKFSPITGDMKDYLSENAKNNVIAAKGSEIGLSPIDIGIFDSSFQINAPLMSIDNQALNLSRYPNSDSSEDWLIGQPVDPKGGNNTMPTISLPNEEKLFNMSYRTEDFIYHGYIAWGWASSFFKGTLNKDAKTINGTTTTYYGITAGQKKPVHMFNSFEAIDQPGEWYYDKSSDMLYIYPFEGTTAESKLYVSNSAFDMISANGTNNLNFEGIRFTSSARRGIKLDNTNNVTINNCIFNNFGSTAVYADNSTNFTIKNSDLYNMADSAIYVNGGNFDTFEPSGNRITNNVIHNTGRNKEFNVPAVSIRGVEPHVDHNEFYNIPLAAVMFSGAGDKITSVNSVIEYNKFHECCTNGVDLAVVYGGRDLRALGTKVRYNHFYNISNNMDAYGFSGSAVFGDDATSSVEITNNIVGPGCSGDNTEAFKFNWGHDNVISNNLIIDLPTFFYIYKFNDFVDRIQKQYDASFGSEPGVTLTLCWDNANYQKNWPWVKAFKDGKGYYVPNEVSNNVMIYTDNYPHSVSGWSEFNNAYYIYNNGRPGSDEPDIEGFTTNLIVQKKNGTDNRDLFVDYEGGNYNLTPETLAKAPGFENIDQSDMGIKTFEYDGKTLTPGGGKPTVSGVEIEGLAKVGKTINAKYTYSDSEGHENGSSYANFYLLDDENETYYINYKKVSDNISLNDFKVTAECEGKWIKCKVTPVNENGSMGEPVWSAPVYVEPSGSADKDALYALVQEVKTFMETAETGSQPGQYPESEVKLIDEAVKSAEAVLGDASATQFGVDGETAALAKAFKRFKESQNIAENVTRINVAPLIAQEDSWTTKGSNFKFENGSLKVFNGYEWASYNETFKNTEFSFRYKQKTDSWGGMYFAQSEISNFPWAATGILFCFKPDCVELQIRDGITACSEDTGRMIVNRDFGFESDRTYNITMGMYDVSSTSVRIYMTVDGEKLFDTTVNCDALVSKEGYFGVLATSESEVTLSGALVDKSELKAILDETKIVLDNAQVGTDYNQYSASDIAKLKAAYDSSKAVYDDEGAVSDSVGRATYSLSDALAAFRKTAVTTKNFTDDGSVDLNYYVDKSTFTVADSVKAEVKGADKALPEIDSTSSVILMNIPFGTKLSGTDWDGTFRLPTTVSSPSGKAGSLKISKVFAFGGDKTITSDGWIKLTLKGMKDEKLAYLADGGNYKTISDKSGTEPMYREADGNDAVIYTKVMTEIVAFTTGGSNVDDPDEPSVIPGGAGGGAGGGGTTTRPSGNKGTNGFYSGETTNPSISNPF